MKNMSISALREKLEAKEISAKELAELYVNQIAAEDPCIKAFISLSDKIMSEAEEADRRIRAGASLPITGIPFAVKDNICTKAIRTTCASRLLENYIPVYSAAAVEKLTNAGAYVLGKTNLDEFGMGSSCENSAFGRTLNPLDPAYSPGGSSGGSAAAVAGGMVPFALGSDTGGSVRQPAAHCGIVGMKPTYGAVSRYGLVAFASSLDQIGPMTRTVRDNALVFSLMKGKDPRDMTSRDTDLSAPELKGLRFGIIKEFEDMAVSAEVGKAFRSAAAALRDMGLQEVEISVPALKYALEAYYIISSAEASSNLARFDGIRYGRRSDSSRDVESLYKNSRAEGFGREVKRRIMLGSFVLSSGYSEKYYRNALRVKSLVAEEFRKAFELCDVLISPVTPSGPKLSGETQSPVSVYREDIFTVPANLAGIPALCLPWGRGAGSMPLGVQLMGPEASEGLLYALGAALEKGGEL